MSLRCRHRLLALVLGPTLAPLTACDSQPTPGPAPTAGPAAAPLASGTRVVAAVTKVSFREGAVLRSDGQQVTITLTPTGGDAEQADAGNAPTQTVDRDAVWPIAPLDAMATAREASKKGGEHGICKIEITGRDGALAAWHPCEITGGAGGKLRVRDAYGERHTVDPDAVVLPNDDKRATIATFLARERRHRAFDDAVEAAGRPFRPPKWDPAAGDRVVVHFVGPSWYGGEVLEHKRDKRKVRIRYDGGTWDDRDVSPLEIAPVPTSPLPVRVDGYALVRPDKPTKRWEPVRVKQRDGEHVVVVDRDERERRIAAADLLPIVPVKSEDASSK